MRSRELRVPNELWLEIFRWVPKKTLKALSLTHTKFKDISRPLVFSHLDLHPYAFAKDVILLPRPANVAKTLERLDFWCTDEIAPHVRPCNSTPWEQTETTWSFSKSRSPYHLLFSFLERLGRFTGLRRFYGRRVYFSQFGMANLCRTPGLTDVQLDNCGVASGEHIDTTSLYLRVSRVLFSPGVAAQEGVDLWMLLLRPERLLELDLRFDLRLLGKHIADIPSFLHIYKLTITMDFGDISIDHEPLILSKFPAVTIFEIIDPIERPAVPIEPPTIFPVLQQYTGSHPPLTLFLHRSTLTHISITNLCSPNDFITQSRAIPGPNHITSFNATFNTSNLDMATLGAICAFLPRLTELCLRIVHHAPHHAVVHRATTFFTDLADTHALPVALVRLSITWDTVYSPRPASNFDEIRESLVGRYPMLRALWFDAHDFVFNWRKSRVNARDPRNSNV
ncbi:hypothetical protein K438DRAFT_1850393 [Mycena galopus ATCC 62051]|nr:hypothetical protein K438DRAFT_1850393 [Mycena galopus ATCC 62051]